MRITCDNAKPISFKSHFSSHFYNANAFINIIQYLCRLQICSKIRTWESLIFNPIMSNKIFCQADKVSQLAYRVKNPLLSIIHLSVSFYTFPLTLTKQWFLSNVCLDKTGIFWQQQEKRSTYIYWISISRNDSIVLNSTKIPFQSPLICWWLCKIMNKIINLRLESTQSLPKISSEARSNCGRASTL